MTKIWFIQNLVCTRSKNYGQIRIIPTNSEFLNMFTAKYHFKYNSKCTNSCYVLFYIISNEYIHHFMWQICLSKTSVCLEGQLVCISEKDCYTDSKVMIKKLYCCFCTKTPYSLILNYRGVAEGMSGV